ncbi:MAG: PAS domain-containing sensor histidine kinase [bacterium]
MPKASYLHPLVDIEAALRSVIEATDVPLLALSKSGDLLLLNWRMQAITGVSPGRELQSKFLESAMPVEQQGALLLHVRRVLDGQAPESEPVEWTFRTKEGGERTIPFTTIVLRDSTGGSIGALYIGQRAGSRSRAVERDATGAPSLRDQDENISSLVFSIDVASGRIAKMNQASAYLLGYYPNDFLADPKLLSARVMPEYHEAFEASLLDARRGVARSIEVGFARRDNELMILALMLYPGRDREDNVVSVEAIGRDITARKEAEQQLAHSLDELQSAYDRLQAQHEELQSLDNLKSQVLANVSHELRTPLVTIRGYNELMLQEEMGALNDRQRKGLEISAKSIQRLLALIENLIDFARLEKDRYRMSRDLVDLGALLSEIVADSADTLRQKALTVALDLEPQPVLVLGDRTRLKQALRNLIDNAEKFSEPSSTIRLELRRSEDRVTVAIADSGIGIPPEERSKIFDTFYQVDGSSTRPYPGLGIGLAIVREIVELHGGHIAVDSEVGQGSRFVVNLPSPEVRQQELAETAITGKIEADDDHRIELPPDLGDEDQITGSIADLAGGSTEGADASHHSNRGGGPEDELGQTQKFVGRGRLLRDKPK